MLDPDAILQAAEAVVRILQRHRVDAVALKLYAGGYKSKADIIELLAHNPDVDRADVRAVCARYRLAGLDDLIAEADAT